KYKANGIKQFLSTDISKDGLLEGPSFQLYKKIKSEIPEISLIASGGISNLNDIEELENIGCEAAIVGKAIYENRVSLADLKKWV
ncbi:MAG TPA: HisA/HisF-related TIM barrel protein, partial [Chitinophagaceae bacterium]|nr:HisA/HisF-related TIM barrel protein [Chitinophagaceae bacterium]